MHNRIDFSHIEIPVVTIAVDDEIQVGTPKLPLIVNSLATVKLRMANLSLEI